MVDVTTRSSSYHFFARWTAFAYQNAAWVILAAILIALTSINYTINNLGVHTDTTEMLSEELPFRINHERYKVEFPQYKDTMILALDAQTPEQTYASAKRLTAVLKEDTTPSHKTNNGTMGIKYVKIIRDILNGLIKGVVKITLNGEKIMANMLGTLRS